MGLGPEVEVEVDNDHDTVAGTKDIDLAFRRSRNEMNHIYIEWSLFWYGNTTFSSASHVNRLIGLQ